MTNITIFKSNGKYIGFECIGHAGFADAGEDIVCAAISVLTINTINSIEQLTKDAFSVSSDEDTGTIKMHFESEASYEAAILMCSLELGLISVADQYGEQYLQVVIQEV